MLSKKIYNIYNKYKNINKYNIKLSYIKYKYTQ